MENEFFHSIHTHTPPLTFSHHMDSSVKGCVCLWREAPFKINVNKNLKIKASQNSNFENTPQKPTLTHPFNDYLTDVLHMDSSVKGCVFQ